MSSTPVRKLVKLQDELKSHIDQRNWDDASAVARNIVKLLPAALDKNTCETGKPHLDGVFHIGTMLYSGAPPKTRRSIDLMNHVIKNAKRTLR